MCPEIVSDKSKFMQSLGERANKVNLNTTSNNWTSMFTFSPKNVKGEGLYSVSMGLCLRERNRIKSQNRQRNEYIHVKEYDRANIDLVGAT